MKELTLFKGIIKRDLCMAYRQRAEILNPLLFFIIVCTLFPLAITPRVPIQQILAPGIIWVAALLATFLALDNLFRSDFEDGTLEQWAINSSSFTLLITAKLFAHWLVTGFPLVVIAPLLATLLHLPTHALIILMLTLIIGTPILSLIGGIASALTVGLHHGSILLALIILPLFVPVLIFGAGATFNAISDISVKGELAILLALLVISLMLAPFAAAAALRTSLV